MVSKLFLKPFKDVKDMKGRMIAIALVFMVTLGLTIGGLYAKGMMVETRDQMFENSDYADLEVSVNDANGTILNKLKDSEDIKEVEGRLILHGLIDEPDEVKPILLVGIDPDESKMNTYSLRKGEEDITGNEILLAGKDPAFGVGDEFKASIVGNKSDFKVSGYVKSAEYAAVPPVPGSSIPMPGDASVGYIDIEHLQEISSIQYNNILVNYESSADKKDVKDDIRRITDEAGLNGINGKKDEYIYQIFESAIEEEEKVIPIMSAIFSVIGAVLIIVVISKIILSQQKEMGVLMAMGYSQKRIVTSYLSFGAVFGLITGILGGLLGIFVGYMWAVYGLQIFMNVDVVTKFTVLPFLISLAMGIGLVMFAVLISVYRINKMTAMEAMRTEESEDTILKINISEKLKNISKFSLRNIIRKPKRLIALIIVLSLTIGMSGSWLIMMDSMVGQADNWEDHQNWDLQVTFSLPADDENIQNIAANYSDEIKSYETYTVAHGESDGKNLKMLGIPPDSEMIDFIKLEGDLNYDDDKCLITSKLSNDLDKGVGDTLTVESDSNEVNLKVIGIVNDLREKTIFLSRSKVQEITGMEDLSSGVYLKTDHDIQDAKRALYGLQGVSYVISSSDFDSSMDTMIDEMRGLLYFMFWMNLSLLILTVITVSMINVLERKSEYALLEMLGYRKRDSAKIIFQEIMTVGIFSIIIGVPTTYIFSIILRDIYSDLIFYYPLIITAVTVTVIIASCIVFFLLSMISPVRVIKKMDIADALRERCIE